MRAYTRNVKMNIMALELAGLDELPCVCSQLRRTARLVSVLYDGALEPAGVTVTQYALLARIGRADGLSRTVLAAQVGMDRTTLTRNLVPLERKGLVASKPSKDRRAKMLHLTANGKKKVPKYINTPDFPKINTLWGYDFMKQHVSEDGISSVIVVESPMSVLKLKSLGFHRAVATFGQFSREQAMLLIAMERVYYWPDNDPAGWKNAHTVMDVLKPYTDLRIVPVLPQEKGDPGDLDRDADVMEYLHHAYPASLFPMKSPQKLATLETLYLALANTNIGGK